LLDERLEVFLMKHEVGKHWDKIQIDTMTKDELVKRRDESLKAYYDREN
jgi:hypothetical protein